jgi:hypothetical protein
MTRRRGGGGGGRGRGGGIQNQKQEPHTKMWGKKAPAKVQVPVQLSNAEGTTTYLKQTQSEALFAWVAYQLAGGL